MDAVYLSHKDAYMGNYVLIKRTPNFEVSGKAHYHDFYEVQFYPSDTGELILENKTYALRKGDVVLLNIFENHKINFNPQTYKERYCISMDSSFVLSICSEKTNLLNIFNPSNIHYPVFHLEDAKFQQFMDLFKKYENIRITYGRDIMERSILLECLALLYDHCFDGQHINQTASDHIKIISQLLSYIDSHISEDLSLERLSSMVNVSKYYICRLFKKYTGYTLNDYIISLRIEKAKQFLRSEESISDICKKVGFYNYSYFYKTFKSITGFTPSAYRENLI